jgi:hypothetical protein
MLEVQILPGMPILNQEGDIMNNESKNLAEEIQKLNPCIIIIFGCTNPTYSSDCFYEVLLPIEKIQFGRIIETSLWNGTITEWIEKTITKIHPDYELVKVKNVYVVGEYDHDDDDYLNSDEVVIDYGGSIELIFLDKLK